MFLLLLPYTGASSQRSVEGPARGGEFSSASSREEGKGFKKSRADMREGIGQLFGRSGRGNSPGAVSEKSKNWPRKKMGSGETAGSLKKVSKTAVIARGRGGE